MLATSETIRELYARRMGKIRADFDAGGGGIQAVKERAKLVDDVVRELWATEVTADPKVANGLALIAIGGYGRGQLFPYSDIDVLFCTAKGTAPKDVVRRVTQGLWDCGLRVSPVVRALKECERFDAENAEFGFALVDRRRLVGDDSVFEQSDSRILSKMIARDAKAMRAELLGMTRERHHKYGDTLFHLEPNIKECPGGLRDANVCGWLRTLREGKDSVSADEEFDEATRFLAAARCFLHWRHERDDNVLDWQAQDAAAALRIGTARRGDAAYWMRAHYRHARAIERTLLREAESAGVPLLPGPQRRIRMADQPGFCLRDGRFEMEAAAGGRDPAAEPEFVLAIFAAAAKTGARLSHQAELRIADSIPMLSAHLEEGPGLWRSLSAILTGEFAGQALRSMHALGLLDLILPEFHGIDALVVRDAYHRYTVDEHTFVVIDTLHSLEAESPEGAPEWRVKLGQMMRELQHPELLYLAALLHDTGKGRAGDRHAEESVSLARAVLDRLVMDAYDAQQVLQLIEQHLDMSIALRRDIFDAETVSGFAAKVRTHESLRMLTLFTYADIQAVHPDALTPWKAENLWRLSMHAANQMDRSVDEERVRVHGADERIDRVIALMPSRGAELKAFVEGFPERYLTTRTAEQVREHFEMASRFDTEPVQIGVRYGASMNEIMLVTRDRPSLFANIAGALAAWGMNVVTADGFANAQGVVVDSFRFTDTFRTLELNVSERERFIHSVREVVSGRESAEKMLAGRRRGRRKAPRLVVETDVQFDEQASSHSTLLQVIAQDVPGLLRAISKTLSRLGYNVEVALVDTEGETAIDVFYLTHEGAHLSDDEKASLRAALVGAIDENAG